MALLITITDAGRAEVINADNTGTGPVVIAEIGFGTGQYAPSKAQTALTNEVKRVSSIAGQAVAADTIHVMAKDEGPDAYNVGEFGLYSASGTLVAVYSQAAASGWIIQKAGASTLLLAVDIILESLDAASLSFGDITFLNPPATTETPGVVQLEDSLTSPSTSKALTAKQGKALQDGKQPLDATLTALAALVTAADKMIYATGSDQFATTPLSAFIRTLLDDANATAALATLGAAPLNSPGLTGTPTAPTAAQATNNTQLATTAFVKAAIAALVDSSPVALDTLNELAAALGDDPNFATTMTNALALKAPLASPALTGTPTAPTAAAGTNTTQLATTAFVQSAVGVGAVALFARSTAPSGWLKSNGAAISRATYADLFAAIGTTFGAGDGATTFNLPDLRGEFLRGWDDGRGADSGRVFGSFQDHAIELHNHTLPTGSASLDTTSGIWGVKDANWEEITGPSPNTTPATGEVAVTGSSGYQAYAATVAGNYAAETRPRNIALLACIKY